MGHLAGTNDMQWLTREAGRAWVEDAVTSSPGVERGRLRADIDGDCTAWLENHQVRETACCLWTVARPVTCAPQPARPTRARHLTGLFATAHRPDACAHSPIEIYIHDPDSGKEGI